MKFKVAIRPKPVRADGTVQVKIRVCHNDKTRYIGTDYCVLPKYFDEKEGTIKPGGEYTQEKADRANTKLQIKVGVMAEKSEGQKSIDIKSLLNLLRDDRTNYDMYALIDDRIAKYKKLGNVNYQRTFECTKVVLERFTGAGLLPFKAIDRAWLIRLETWMRVKGMKPNSIGVRMRDIRTAYNEAITNGHANISDYPFRGYKIPKEATKKRNLSAQQIATIYRKEIPEPLMSWARDMFMLSFFLQGINTVDLFRLKKIEDGRIYYIRSKGKKPYSIKVWPEAQEIFDRYPGNKYLLDTLDKYTDYRNAVRRIDKELKDIATLCKIEKPVSTYYCRHSWATIGRSIGISVDDLSMGLGHQRPKVEMTMIYLEEDQILTDLANWKIIDHILKAPPSGQSPLSETDVVCLLDQ